MKPSRSALQRGFGAFAAIMVLVVLAAIAAAVVRLSSAQQLGAAQDLGAARAAQAARAGVEWGLYQAFRGSWTSCAGSSQTLDLSTDLGMRVTVSCNSTLYNEGESAPGVPQTVRVYTIDAVACNTTTSCPDASRATGPAYVEPPSLDAGFRYCELGFGQGVSANLLAATHPQGHFEGTDFNPRHASGAAGLSAAAGLKNTAWHDDSFEQFLDRDTEPFDYISLHGIWSWVSPQNRHFLVEILRRRLAEREREQLVRDVAEARAEFATGSSQPATVKQLMDEVDGGA